MTIQDKLAILGAMKNETEEDVVPTLIYTIIQHFIGNPNIFKERASSQLINLYCSTMSDYRWYKDVFLSKITLRKDRYQGFWKERFIAGLPKLFAKKVKINLQKHYINSDYNQLSYGQIHNIVIETGIQVCNDFKLQNKLRKESIINKRELGSFCKQYGVEPIRAPSAQSKKKHHKMYKKYHRKNYNKPYKKYKNFQKDKNYEYKGKTKRTYKK